MLEPAIQTKLTAFSRSGIEVTTTSFVSTGLSVVLSANTLYLIEFGSYTSDAGDGLEFKLTTSATIDGSSLAYSVDGAVSRLVPGNTHVIAPGTTYVLQMNGAIKTSGLTTLTLQCKKTTDLNDPTTLGAGVYLNARPI